MDVKIIYVSFNPDLDRETMYYSFNTIKDALKKGEKDTNTKFICICGIQGGLDLKCINDEDTVITIEDVGITLNDLKDILKQKGINIGS